MNENICPRCKEYKNKSENYCAKCSKIEKSDFSKCLWGGLIMGLVFTILINLLVPNDYPFPQLYIVVSFISFIGIKIIRYS